MNDIFTNRGEETKEFITHVVCFLPYQETVIFFAQRAICNAASHRCMSRSLIEIKAVLDEILKLIDDRRLEPDRLLRRASAALLALEDHQDDPLPGDLKYRFSSLLCSLRANAWNASPEVGIAEIKRFYIALLRAIQLPGQREPDYARNA